MIKTQSLEGFYRKDWISSVLLDALSAVWKLPSGLAIVESLPHLLVQMFDIPCCLSLRTEVGSHGIVLRQLCSKGLPFDHITAACLEGHIANYLNSLDPLQKPIVLREGDPLYLRHQCPVLVVNDIAFMVVVLASEGDDGYVLCFPEHTTDIASALWLFMAVAIHEIHVHSKLDCAEAKLFIDDLTGLFNYRYMTQVIEREARRSLRSGRPFSVLFIDLDDFKKVNDRYGHLAGTGILRQVGDILLQMHREIDTVVRYGGDEFVLILVNAAEEEAWQIAERLRLHIATTPFLAEGKTVAQTCSVGLASFPAHTADPKHLLKLADQSMYRSKSKGKNRVSVLTL
ncbi:MAG: GGDEF domain-containing protein [Zetaproteobacteria bacterium]|nr:GGDEF domain-containing protein [Zetaproteobacteria bacterium]